MKETININISGSVFTFDMDAYRLLQEYIETLRHAFASEEYGDEMVDDIEQRIAEILREKNADCIRVVTIEEVKAVIARMGQPEEMEDITIHATNDAYGDETIEIKETTTQTPPPVPPIPQKVKRRLFRDPEHKLIGGVCAGIAAYTGIDPTWIRLIAVALCFASFSIATLVYIILWIVLPVANTPLEKMQMYGEAPTMENISRSMNDTTFGRSPSDQNKSGFQSIIDVLLQIVAWCFKILIILGVVIFIPVLCALILAMLAVIVVFIGGAIAYPDWWSGSQEFFDFTGNPVWPLLCVIGTCSLLAIPIFMLVYHFVRNWKNWKPLSPNCKTWLLVGWLVALALSIVSIAMIVRHTDRMEGLQRMIEVVTGTNDGDNGEIIDVETTGSWEEEGSDMKEALQIAQKAGIVTISVSKDYDTPSTSNVGMKGASITITNANDTSTVISISQIPTKDSIK